MKFLEPGELAYWMVIGCFGWFVIAGLSAWVFERISSRAGLSREAWRSIHEKAKRQPEATLRWIAHLEKPDREATVE